MGGARCPDVTQRHGGLDAAAADSILRRVASPAAAVFDAPVATVAATGTDGAWFRTTHGSDLVAGPGSAPEPLALPVPSPRNEPTAQELQ
ncbi:hypothetical protein ACWD7F_31400 [Streptomyces sp. NPDC005122]